jgi:hypothetical protein
LHGTHLTSNNDPSLAQIAGFLLAVSSPVLVVLVPALGAMQLAVFLGASAALLGERSGRDAQRVLTALMPPPDPAQEAPPGA